MQHVKLGRTGLRGLAPVPRHDDLRPAVRRAGVARHPRRAPPRAASLPRHRRRLPARRQPRHGRAAPRRSSATGCRASASEFIVATKCVGADGPAAVGPRHVAQAHPRRHRRLAAPAADRLRRPLPAAQLRPDTPIDETLRGARRRRPRRQGALRRLLELASPTRWPARSAAARCSASRASTRCSRATTCSSAQIERELLPLCAEEGSAVIPYNPLAGGLLTGKHQREARAAPRARASRSARAAQRYQERYWHEREFETVEALRTLAAEAGMTMATLAAGAGCWRTRRSPRRSSAPAGPTSSPTAWRPPSKGRCPRT